MNDRRRPVQVLAAAWLFLNGAVLSADEGFDFFENKIRPVLVQKCYDCHSAGAKKVKGGLLLDTREGVLRGGDTGPAVVPKDPSRSLLLKALRHEDGLEMPPDAKLDARVAEDFAKWIALGAPDPRIGTAAAPPEPAMDLEAGRKHWAFLPLSTPAVPEVRAAAWARSDIDRFVQAGLEARGLRPVKDATASDLLRRISFDLTGLPPAPAEVAEFEAAYAGAPEEAVAARVDALLADPRFGERWGRHWLDVARYAESNGGTSNVLIPLAPRYRDYVIDAFNADKPYDRFVLEQIAGDLLPAESEAGRAEQVVATGFLALGLKDLRERNVHRFQMEAAAEQIDVVGRAFLGMTLACARCHDHKFDPIPTRDYYALAGIFYSSQPRMGLFTDTVSYVSGLEPLSGGPPAFTDDDLDVLGEEMAKARKANLFVRDESHRQLAKAGLLKASEKQKKEFLDGLPVIRKAQADKEAQAARLHAIRKRHHAFMQQAAVAMRDVEPQDVAIHIRGEDAQLGEIVPRGFPQVLLHASTPEVDRRRSGRLELARWIASPDHPLTSRVMVNRVWQHLFGAGLVESPDNFGRTGQPPSHPELLDHVAGRFVAQGWSVKALVRAIMRSRVYRISADHDSSAFRADPGNRLLWRMNRRRLSSDALFDAMMFASGDLEPGRPPQRFAIVEGDQRIKSFDRAGWLSPVARRRTVYQPIFRGDVRPEWSIFDFPDPEMPAGRRDVTTIPTQSLYLMNSAFVVERSRRLAALLRALPDGGSDGGAVRHAYLRILSRAPAGPELSEALAFLRGFPSGTGKPDPLQPLAAFCQALFATAEFSHLY